MQIARIWGNGTCPLSPRDVRVETGTICTGAGTSDSLATEREDDKEKDDLDKISDPGQDTKQPLFITQETVPILQVTEGKAAGR